MINLIFLITGLALLITGAQFTVSSTSRIAAHFGVPQLVIGMTLVAFGTGIPELVLNLISAWNGSTSLAFGNLIGSSTINISLVLGITALIQPLVVRKSIITREIPFLILATFAILTLASDTILNGYMPLNVIDRSDGIILILFFCVFLYYTVHELITHAADDAFVASLGAASAPQGDVQIKTQFAMLLFGLIAVLYGARITLQSALVFAQQWGISESIVGLTILSIGTTLPELVTCIVASRKGAYDIALGNLVGSNILNLLFFFGLVSVVHPIPLPEYGLFDLTVLCFLSLAIVPIALRGPMRITRAEGLFLIACYLGATLIRLGLSY